MVDICLQFCQLFVYILQEYSLIMSERDSVHKEIEKLQEEIKEKNKKLQSQEGRTKHHDDEVSTVLPTFSTQKIANF